MKSNEEEQILIESLNSERLISKVYRRLMKDPKKLCNQCMNEFVWQTPEGKLLCEECNREYCETKLG